MKMKDQKTPLPRPPVPHKPESVRRAALSNKSIFSKKTHNTKNLIQERLRQFEQTATTTQVGFCCTYIHRYYMSLTLQKKNQSLFFVKS